MKQIYLDYAATTPVDKRVYKSMRPYFLKNKNLFGNPNSVHIFGQKAITVIDEARAKIADIISVNEKEIIFTGSATESNNLIIRGVLKSYYDAYRNTARTPKIIISSIEHPSVLETAKDIEKEGVARIVRLSVDENGIVDTNKLSEEIDEDTILVSVMWVNNETGAIQPIKEISEIIKKHRDKKSDKEVYPIFHTDAVQATLFNKIDVGDLGVDALTISSHKIYGPKGIGLIYISKKIQEESLLSPVITGGGQEFGFRSGTQNTPYIIGFTEALKICEEERETERNRIKKLSEYFYKTILKNVDGAELNGNENKKSPHIINLYIPKDDVSEALSVQGIAVSSGSACSQRLVKPSHVLEAMGISKDKIRRSIRISLGRMTKKSEVDYAIKEIIMISSGKSGNKEIDWCTN